MSQSRVTIVSARSSFAIGRSERSPNAIRVPARSLSHDSGSYSCHATPLPTSSLRSARVIRRRALRAIRVVEVEDARLGERRRAGAALGPGDDPAARERVLGVAVELDRAALERGREHRVTDPAELERRGVLLGQARRLIFGPPRQGDDLLLLVAPARTDPRERHRRAHQLEEVAARQRILGRLVRPGRELVAGARDLERGGALELAQRLPVAVDRRGRQIRQRRGVVVLVVAMRVVVMRGVLPVEGGRVVRGRGVERFVLRYRHRRLLAPSDDRSSSWWEG